IFLQLSVARSLLLNNVPMLGHRQAITIIVFSAELLLKNLSFRQQQDFDPCIMKLFWTILPA
ncbi:MAG: hypothetical protein ACLRVT_09250, partial [Oscillospiraceae bacterium]